MNTQRNSDDAKKESKKRALNAQYKQAELNPCYKVFK